MVPKPWSSPGTREHGWAKGEVALGGALLAGIQRTHGFSLSIPTSGSAPLREDRSLEVPHRLLLMAEFPG